MEEVFEIPGKLKVAWCPEALAIVDTWTSYHVTLPEFREAVLVKGMNRAKADGGRAWIVDSSGAKGVFSQEIQDFIGTTVFPSFARNGIKYFVTISETASALTKMTVRRYVAQASPSGVQTIELASVEDGIMWLQAQYAAESAA